MSPYKKRKLSNTNDRNELPSLIDSPKNILGTPSPSKKRPRDDDDDDDDDSQEESQPPQEKKSSSPQQDEGAPTTPTQDGKALGVSVEPIIDRLVQAYRDQVNLTERVTNLGLQIKTAIEMIKPLVDTMREIKVLLSLFDLKDGQDT